MLKSSTLRAALYWVFTGAFVILASVVAYAEGTGSSAPDWVDVVSKLLLGVGAFFEITAGTNVRGDAIDPSAFPPKLRKVVYYIAAALKVVTLIAPVVLSSLGESSPWANGATAVLLVLGGMLSLVASSHVVPGISTPKDPAQPEGGATR